MGIRKTRQPREGAESVCRCPRACPRGGLDRRACVREGEGEGGAFHCLPSLPLHLLRYASVRSARWRGKQRLLLLVFSFLRNGPRPNSVRLDFCRVEVEKPCFPVSAPYRRTARLIISKIIHEVIFPVKSLKKKAFRHLISKNRAEHYWDADPFLLRPLFFSSFAEMSAAPFLRRLFLFPPEVRRGLAGIYGSRVLHRTLPIWQSHRPE